MTSAQLRRKRLATARRKGTHTKEQWEALKKEFQYCCVRCDLDWHSLVKDHIIPLYQGGSDGIENIQPLCPWCNASKGPEDINWVAIRRSFGWKFYPIKLAKKSPRRFIYE